MENLSAQLNSGDMRTANRAALVLLSYESEDAFKLLRKALTDSASSTTRSAVIVAFTILQDPRIRAETLRVLDDSNDETVSLAQTYLEEVIGDAAAPELLAIARDAKRSPRERSAALKVLGKVGREGTVDGLLDLLDDGDRNIVAATTVALRGITGQPFEDDAATWRSWYRQNRRLSREEWLRVGGLYYKRMQQLESEIAALKAGITGRERELVASYEKLIDVEIELKRYDVVISVLNEAGPVEVQTYAAQALGKAKAASAARPLIDKARGFDAGLSKACVEALGLIGDPSAGEVVALKLSAGDQELKLAAVVAYAMLPGSDLTVLLPLRSDASSAVRAAVAKAIGNCKWHDGFTVLVGMLSDQSSDVRSTAASALGMLGDKAAVQPLINIIKDENEKVRWSVVYSLLLIADPSSFDALVEASRDDVPSVKQAAVVALEKLGDKRAVDRLFEMTLLEPAPQVADQAWTSLLQLAKGDETLMLSLAEKLEQTGRFDRAEALLKTLADGTETTSQAMEARKRLAKAYLSAGTYQAAAAYFRRVLDASSGDRQALLGLAQALKGQDDWAGLAGLCSSNVEILKASPEVKQDYLTALRELIASKDYATAVLSAKQVLGLDLSSDKEFETSLTELQAKALPLYIKALVAQLGSQDDDARAAARNALVAYGRAAGEALIEGLENGSSDVRTASLDLLVPLTGGRSFGYDPAKDPGEQGDALTQWHNWLAAP